jgi:hypothetical protein
MTVRVRFQGEEYWLVTAESLDDAGPLAYLHHCDEQGVVKMEYLFADSYAYYWPDLGVMRFDTKIGSREDIEIL